MGGFSTGVWNGGKGAVLRTKKAPCGKQGALCAVSLRAAERRQNKRDTLRVSLTADPVQEVYAAKEILRAAGVRKDGVNIISCPTCGRTSIDLIGLVDQVEQALQDCSKSITVAVMGCVVNGPGEAREADVGIAGGEDCGVLFVKGEPVRKLPYGQLLPALLDQIQRL